MNDPKENVFNKVKEAGEKMNEMAYHLQRADGIYDQLKFLHEIIDIADQVKKSANHCVKEVERLK